MHRSILVLALLALAAAAPALEVPSGKAALVEAVVGKAGVVTVKGLQPLSVGMAISFGDRVRTGENGRVFLRLPNQAVTRLAANTELTLDAPGKRKGTFLSLAKGWARFLVGQRQPDESFEVATHNAVAAVKGTDMEVGDDGSTHARVWDSEHHPALSFSDPKTGQGVDLNPGEGVDYDGAAFKRLQDLVRALKDAEQRYKGLPKPELGAPTGGQGGTGGGPAPTAATTPPPTGNLDEGIKEALNELSRDMKADAGRDAADSSSDLAAGRVAVDRFGVQVQVSNYVVHPQPNELLLATYSLRTSGPMEGVSYATQDTLWNTALPADWTSVVRMGLNDPANIIYDSDHVATGISYYRTAEITQIGDGLGDLLVSNTAWGSPYSYYGYFYQAYYQDLWGFGPSQPAGVELIYYLYSAQSSAGSLAGDVDAGALAATGGVPYPCTYLYPTAAAVDGGISLTYSQAGGLVQTIHVLDGQGNVQAQPGNEAGAYQFGGTVGSTDFLGLDHGWNIEVSYNVPGLFAQPIDLVVMPQMFDLMEGLQPFLQANSGYINGTNPGGNGGGGCGGGGC